MTTPEATVRYLRQHQARQRDREIAVFNPHEKPKEELPMIMGFNNGGSPLMLSAVLLAEDGTYLGGHCCSDEGYMLHDLGILEGTRDDRHETFRKHYPDGYRMEFVGSDEVKARTHTKLEEAYRLNQEEPSEAEAES